GEAAFQVVDDVDQVGGPALEPGVVGGGQAQDAGGDAQRQRAAEVGDQVGPAGRLESVDQLVARGPDHLVAPCGQRLLPERVRDQVAVVLVVGVVHAQDRS